MLRHLRRVHEQAAEDGLGIDLLAEPLRVALPPGGVRRADIGPEPLVHLQVVGRMGIKEMLLGVGDAGMELQFRVRLPESLQEVCHTQRRTRNIRGKGMDRGGSFEHLGIIREHPPAHGLVLGGAAGRKVAAAAFQLLVGLFKTGADLLAERREVAGFPGTGKGFPDVVVLLFVEDVAGAVPDIGRDVERLVALRGGRQVPVGEIIDIVHAAVLVRVGPEFRAEFVRRFRLGGEAGHRGEQGRRKDGQSFHFVSSRILSATASRLSQKALNAVHG